MKMTYELRESLTSSLWLELWSTYHSLLNSGSRMRFTVSRPSNSEVYKVSEVFCWTTGKVTSFLTVIWGMRSETHCVCMRLRLTAQARLCMKAICLKLILIYNYTWSDPLHIEHFDD